MSEMSATHASPAAVSSSVPPSHLYDGRPLLLPVTIRAPNFANWDFVPSDRLSRVVAPPENPASSPAPRTSSRSLGQDAVYSRSRDNVFRVSPVSMVNPEPAVMSVCSNDSDPDMVDELWRF